MKINDIINTKIIDLTQDGDGVAKVDGYTIFINDVLPQEEVECKIYEMKKNYGKAQLIKIIKISPYRIKPMCDNFGKCGGCDLLHMDYNSQLKMKKKMVEDSIKHIGKIDNFNIEEVIGMENPYYYRNKIQMPFSYFNGKTQCGYYQKRSHQIISIKDCILQPKEVTELIIFIRNLCNELNIKGYDEINHQGFIRHLIVRCNYKMEMMIIFVTTNSLFPKKDILISKLLNRYKNIVSIIQNINDKKTNVILGDESLILYGKDEIIDKLFSYDFSISHRSFFQINRIQTEKLYQKVLEFSNLTKDEEVIDGYCGIGTISLLLAKNAKFVYGIEVVNEAIKNAKENAKINNINNVSFQVGKVEDNIEEFVKKNVQCIVLDPPRKGLEKNVIDTLISSSINRIVYVSCNFSTLARDLNLLKEKYFIKRFCLVDMFCHTSGIESVALLEKK